MLRGKEKKQANYSISTGLFEAEVTCEVRAPVFLVELSLGSTTASACRHQSWGLGGLPKTGWEVRDSWQLGSTVGDATASSTVNLAVSQFLDT